MNHRKKICFFDIDGTLVEFGKSDLPESTKQALVMARANGHELILCSGRCKNQMYSWLFDYGFDGLVASAGAYVEYHGKEVSRNSMSKDNLRKLFSYFGENGIVGLFQGQEHKFILEEYKAAMQEMLFDKMFGDSAAVEQLLGDTQIIGDVEEFLSGEDKIETVVYGLSPYLVPKMQEDLGEELKVMESSFHKSEGDDGEIYTKGINKAYGMQKMIDYLGIPKEDVISFGDGANDLEMMMYSPVSVAMGNARDEIKEAATMVTTDIDKDGIYQAMKKLELI